jgi:hypothetical protein
MIKNRYTNPIRHAAFDEAVKLAQANVEVNDIAKRLDPTLPREWRRRIAANAARQVRIASNPSSAAAALLGSSRSDHKADTSRANGAKSGGRPRKSAKPE